MQSGEVHVWTIRLDPSLTAVAASVAALSADERGRMERFASPDDARRFAVRRAAAREVLARQLGVAAAALRFDLGARGKPRLAPPFDRSGLAFNVAHSGDLALCAVSAAGEIGADLERVRSVEGFMGIARRWFSAGENEALVAMAGDRLEAFLATWTRKEAFVKVTGEGLSHPLAAFSVSVAPSEPPRVVAVAGDHDEAARWWLVDLRPAPGFVAALAGRGTRPVRIVADSR